MSNAAVLEKIRKLLALSKSDNVNEAASALQAAQRLASRHRIDLAVAAIEATGAPKSFTVDTHLLIRYGKVRLAWWVNVIAQGVGEANRLTVYRLGGCVYGIGEAADTEIASYLLGWLVGEVERLEKLERSRLPYAMSKGESKAWGSAFRLGCAQTLRDRIREEAERARLKLDGPSPDDYMAALADGAEAVLAMDRNAKYALALVDQDLALVKAVQARAKAEGIRTMKRQVSVSDGDGLARGSAAGKRAMLSGRALK